MKSSLQHWKTSSSFVLYFLATPFFLGSILSPMSCLAQSSSAQSPLPIIKKKSDKNATFATSQVTEPKTYPSHVFYATTSTEVAVGGRIKADFTWDHNGKQPGTTYGLDPAEIPLAQWNYDASRHHNTNMSIAASRIGLEAKHQWDDWATTGYIEADFNGRLSNNMTTGNSFILRARHVYAKMEDKNEVNTVLVGQTWTNFVDPETTPWSTNNLWPSFRQMQLRYTRKLLQNISLSTSLERQNTQTYTYTNTAGNIGSYVDNDNGLHNSSPMPDLVMRLRYQNDGRVLSLKGVLRQLRVKAVTNNGAGLGQGGSWGAYDQKRTAWGLAIAGLIKLSSSVTFMLQFQGGRGVGRYVDDLSNTNGFDGILQVPQSANSPYPYAFKLSPVFNVIGGFTIHWRENMETNIGAAYTKINMPKGLYPMNTTHPANVASPGSYEQVNRVLQRYHVNFIYTLFSKSFLVLEVEHYNRRAGWPKTYFGKDTRIVFSLIRNF